LYRSRGPLRRRLTRPGPRSNRRSRAQTWVDGLALAGVHLAFLQEVPAALAVPKGFHGFPGDLQPLQSGRCRSLILVAERRVPALGRASFVLPDLLDDDVCELDLALPGQTLVRMVNVHASPKPVIFDEAPFAQWRRRAEARVYYSDVISGELAARARDGRLVAAGDFNEALLWDERHRTTTSAEFFERLRMKGLIDVTADAWPQEVTTQTKQPYQVDRIFRTEDVTVEVQPAAVAIAADDLLSDHLPVAFTLRIGEPV